jgi:nitrogen regulatory protein P-II 1
MKKIEALIRTSKFESVHKCISSLAVNFLTFYEVKGIGLESAKTQSYRGSTFSPGYIPRTKLEIVVMDDQVDEVIECILLQSRTGEVGDGKIFISTIEKAYRIRNSDLDEAAL